MYWQEGVSPKETIMSETDETTETTEAAAETTEETSPTRENFQALEELIKGLKAENDELRPLQREKTLREAGFDPDSDRGIALEFAIKAGELEATTEAISEFASARGWDPKPVLTEIEAAQVSAATQGRQIQTASVSDSPTTIDDDIAEARKAGKHAEALRMQTRQAAEKMLSG
jgi:hypothetical protein